MEEVISSSMISGKSRTDAENSRSQKSVWIEAGLSKFIYQDKVVETTKLLVRINRKNTQRKKRVQSQFVEIKSKILHDKND